ncbi:twitchin-like [Tigriopus californicus]|uniref:twitchin-like n=1 Tax=Tigriopus californicus TaxID=6832 RepID=UPI0027DA7918|nr:twitchin-like [Tigriopus californicus]
MASKGEDVDLNDGSVPPDAPIGLEVSDYDATSAILKWKAPINDGGMPLTGYIVEYKEIRESEWVETDKIKPNKYPTNTVKLLSTGQKYEFRVCAVNRAGKSVPSEATPPQVIKSQKSPPKIDLKAFGEDAKVSCKVNQQLILEVPVDGTPAPETSWWLGDAEVKSEGIVKVSHNPNMAKLVLIPAKRSGCGKYTLKAKNQHGEDKATVDVEIFGRPEIPQGSLEVSNVTKKTCLLSWKPPKDDGGAPITTYEIERMETTSEQWLPVGKTKGTSFEVKNLGEGKEYKFLVRAVNKFGDSPDLILEESITAKDEFNPPSQPGPPEICDWGQDFADLRWNTPEEDGGAQIETYRIEIRNRDKRVWQTAASVSESDAVINDHIQPENEYEFRVVAINRAGESEHSKTSKPMVAKERFVKPKIDRSTLGDKSILAGQALRLTANTVGEPPAQISWWSPSGAKYEDSEVVEVQASSNMSTLVLKQVTLQDSGSIKVKAKNSEGLDETEVKINVTGPPGKPIGPLEVSSVHQTGCTLAWKKPESNGGSSIKSYAIERKNVENDHWVPCGSITGKTASVLKDLEYEVKNLVEGAVYMFRVLASNTNGEGEPLECFVPVCPMPSNPVPDKPSTPKVKAQDKKWVSLEWFVPADADVKHYIIEKQEHFLVPKVEDVEEEANENTPQEMNGDAQELKPRPALKTGPSFTGEFQDYCSSWMVAMVTDDNSNSIKITDLGEGSKYRFRIKAVNGSGPSEPSDPTMEVECKGKQRPILDRSCFDPIKIPLGGTIIIQVKFTGNPIPERRWFFAKRELHASGKVLIVEKDHLSRVTINDAQKMHSGQYELRVENEFGQETGLVDVVVLTEPDKPRGPLKIDNIHAEGCSCAWLEPENDGGSPITHYIVERQSGSSSQWTPCGKTENTCCKITQLPTGKEFRLQVKAVNSEGESEPLGGVDSFLTENQFGTPGAPGRPEPIDCDFDNVLVVWDPPRHDGGSRITGYELEARKWKDNNYFPADEIKMQMERGDIKGLETNQVYAARVRAVNAAGPGPWSMDSDELIPKHKSLKPKIVLNDGKDITVQSGTTLTVFASVEAEPPVEDVDFELAGKSLLHDLNQGILIDIKPYKVRLQIDSVQRKMSGILKCEGRNVNGKHSAHVELKVQGLPSKPKGILEVTNVHKNGCRLSWGTPEDDGGLSIEYIVERKVSNESDWTKVITTPNSICDLLDLEQGKEYSFRIIAANSIGNSEPLTILRPIVAKDQISTPLPPGAPEITDWSERHMELVWSPPLDDGGSPITGYQVLTRLNSTGDWQLWETVPAQDCSATLQNLNFGTQYQFQVVASNKVGKSDPSISSRPREARPQALAPSMNTLNMRDVKVTAGSRVKFDVPFQGEPTPEVIWTKEGSDTPIVSSRSQDITQATTENATKLAFNNIARTQDGTYTLTIMNESGKESASATITVLDRPLPIEGLSALLDRSKCSLAWKRPSEDGGAPIDHYQIERFDADKGFWMACGRSKETSFEAIGLLKGHEYRFRVSASNRLGESDPVETPETFLIEADLIM